MKKVQSMLLSAIGLCLAAAGPSWAGLDILETSAKVAPDKSVLLTVYSVSPSRNGNFKCELQGNKAKMSCRTDKNHYWSFYGSAVRTGLAYDIRHKEGDAMPAQLNDHQTLGAELYLLSQSEYRLAKVVKEKGVKGLLQVGAQDPEPSAEEIALTGKARDAVKELFRVSLLKCARANAAVEKRKPYICPPAAQP